MSIPERSYGSKFLVIFISKPPMPQSQPTCRSYTTTAYSFHAVGRHPTEDHHTVWHHGSQSLFPILSLR